MSVILNCQNCGKEFSVKPYKKDTAKYCSRDCMNEAKKGVKRGIWINKICPSCGKEFETLLSKEKKYCSEECRNNHFDKIIPEYNCDVCGKLFTPHSSTWHKYLRGEQKHMTCSKECSRNLKLKGIYVNCANCGKELYRTPYKLELRDNYFCSNKCQGEYKHKQTYEIRQCEICGKDFECSKMSTQRFCSIQCQGKWQSTQIGDLNPRSQKIHMNCTYCNNDILVTPYKLKIQNNFFCNEQCRRNWYSEVYSQSDEWKEESRVRAVSILERGLIPTVYTKPQIKVNDYLDEVFIPYINDYNVKYYSIDNYLTKENLMIEIMGDYWHSNPLKFDFNDLNETQYKRIPKDKAKHTYVSNNYNIEILYLWESDINDNFELCKMLISQYIENKGILSNYHSFNYEIINNELFLKDDTILAYYDYDISQD